MYTEADASHGIIPRNEPPMWAENGLWNRKGHREFHIPCDLIVHFRLAGMDFTLTVRDLDVDQQRPVLNASDKSLMGMGVEFAVD